MELRHIPLAQLRVSTANMRAKGKAEELANLLPSIRARGILVPLIVRPASDSSDTAVYEIVAGKRRYTAAGLIAEELGEFEPLPCAIMAAGDDAAALEASLIENVARLDPDEVTRWESFTRLVREGRSADEIALTFGLTELQVKRTLALGNLLPRIRTLFRQGEIDMTTVRHLTLASKAQQRDWLALADDPNAYAPMGAALKSWLFGGASIPVSAAIFDLATFDGAIVSDLFGEDRWFGDATAFWAAQMAAVEARAAQYRDDGWRDVVVLGTGEYFHGWEHERTPKRKGGKVFIAIGQRGDVTFHEGYLTTKEARKASQGGDGATATKPARPELTAPLQNYVDLHRHVVVRNSLAGDSGIALRVAVAHMIAGSGLWHVRVEPQRATSDAIAESVETSSSEAAFDERRRAVLSLLGFDAETPTVTGGHGDNHTVAGVFAVLLTLPDTSVHDVLALVMAETLEVGSDLIESLGTFFGIDMAAHWQADNALLDLIRDKEVLGAILTEVAGEAVASANQKATGTVKRQIVRDCLNGTGGREKVEGWVPRWMAFPPSAYTTRGGVATVDRAAQVAGLLAVQPEPEPAVLRIAA